MENLLGSLKRENKEREKRLIIADRKLISDMVAYIKTRKICEYDVEFIRKKIIRNALRMYGNKKRSFQDTVGDDFRDYCDQLCVGMRPAETKEIVLSKGITLVLAIALMYAARLIDVFITGGNFFKSPVDINFGFITVTITLIVGIGFTYMYVAKLVSQTGQQMTHKQSFGMIGILAVIMLVSAACAIYLSHIHLFYVEWWLPVLILAVVYSIMRYLYIQYENKLAKSA